MNVPVTNADLSDGAVEPIAVIGMACRVPGADGIDEYWRNLRDGVESIRTFGPDEARAAGATERSVNDPQHVFAAPILDAVEDFDASLFNLTRREAEILDPQHRVLLECAAAALDHAGYDPARFDGDIGVYAGVGSGEYQWYHLLPDKALVSAVGHMAIALSNNTDYASTLIAYKLNLRGPALSVSTACSTGLVAVHLACEAVRNGECDMALAGAASVELMQWHGYTYHEGGILSPDGHCRAFDEKAQGTLWGSGGGMVVLKRLSDAIADGDTVHGVLLGSAINNDGSDKVGFSAPSVVGQSAVIRQALGVAGVDPDCIDYVEAHGTGTNVGDPIEVRALSAALGQSRRHRPTWLGSVKPNIGHLAAAAGVVGLIKTLLSLRNEAIPPTLHYESPNPGLELDQTSLRIVGTRQSWPRTDTPRRAGVSSFGMGGTNAHAIVEEAPVPTAAPASGRAQAVTLSAMTPSALDTLGAGLAAALEDDPDLTLDDVAHTLQVGRRQLPYRRAFVAADVDDAIGLLRGSSPRRLIIGKAANTPGTVFLFPGQGSQRVGMARELYGQYEVVRHWIDQGAELLQPLLGVDLRDILFVDADADTADGEAAAERLRQTGTTQPALFVVEYALAKLWESWGVRPTAMIGHSLGEYVAGCLAGVFSFADGLRVVAARGALIQSAPPGAMIAVPMDEASLDLDGTGVGLAALNAPMASVVSGPMDAIDLYEQGLLAEGIPATRLRTSHAFHSAMLEPLRDELAAVLADVDLRAPQIPVVSNVTGTWLTAEQATDPRYWAEHMCAPVQFALGLRTVTGGGAHVLLEVGPGKALSDLARMQLPTGTPDPVVTLTPKADSETGSLLDAATRLWTLGVDVDFAPSRAAGRRRVPLPGHPFERQRFWIDSNEGPNANAIAEPELPEGRQEMDEWFWMPVWRQTPPAPAEVELDPAAGAWLVVRDGAGEIDPVVETLRGRGLSVATVTFGPSYSAKGRDWTVDVDEPAHMERLVDDLQMAGVAPSRVVYAAPLATRGDLLDPAATGRAVAIGFAGLLHLTQAMAARGLAENSEITIVSRGVHAVTGGDAINPAAAVVLGPLRTLPREFAGLVCRHVDIDDPKHTVKAVLEAVTSTDEVTAYRNGRRWVPDVAPTPAPAASVAADTLREKGVYVITGGLGGIGLTIAEDLARRVHARVVLVGRSAVPARAEWERLAAGSGPQARRIAALLRIEAVGGQVIPIVADICDAAAVEALRDEVIGRFGAVHGIVHAAGVAGGTMVEVQSMQTASAVLRPKIDGTLHLAGAFRHETLDFFALCSSVTSLLGGLGQLDYCAGNAFLDAFAHAAAGVLPWRVLSINWGAWLEVGMAVETLVPAGLHALEQAVTREPVGHPLLETTELSGAGAVCVSELDPGRHWVLAEHRILGTPALPGTAYLEMARAAFAGAGDRRPVQLRDVTFLSPLAVPEGESRIVRVVLDDRTGGGWRIESASGGQWREHARGSVGWAETGTSATIDVDDLRDRCDVARLGASMTESASGLVDFGPRWSSLRTVHTGGGEELALLVAGPQVAAELSSYWLHPAVLDEATAFGDFDGADGSYLPLGYGTVTVFRPMPERLLSHLRHRDTGTSELLTCDITLLAEDGTVVAEITDFLLRRVVSNDLDESTRPSAPAAAAAPVDSSGATVPSDEVGIRPVEGAEAFLRALGADAGPQVVVTALSLKTLLHKVRRIDTALVSEESTDMSFGGESELLAESYVAPSTDAERQLVQLWEEALGLRGIGVEHDFFELGGNSLVASQLIARIRAVMGVKLPMRTVFQSPTVAGMAAALAATLEAVA